MSIRDNAWQMASALSKKEISAVELTNQHYEQIKVKNFPFGKSIKLTENHSGLKLKIDVKNTYC